MDLEEVVGNNAVAAPTRRRWLRVRLSGGCYPGQHEQGLGAHSPFREAHSTSQVPRHDSLRKELHIMSITWSNWRSLQHPANYAGHAVYKIRRSNSGTPARISRLLGVDEHGLLCIGQTANMERRCKQFIRGLERGRGHSEGNLLHLLQKHTSFPRNYSDFEYEYSFAQTRSRRHTSQREEREIKAYAKQHGEPPPLNSAIPNRYGNW